MLGWWETGFRHVSNNKRPILKPDDIKGLKLRTLPSAVHVAYFRALGAIPTPMDWAEVMPALQQGVIDGQENPPSVVYPYRVFEFQKFYSLTSHVNEPNLLLMSAATLAKLPKDVQDAIVTAGREATAFQRKASAEYNTNIMGELDKVMTVNQVPADTSRISRPLRKASMRGIRRYRRGGPRHRRRHRQSVEVALAVRGGRWSRRPLRCSVRPASRAHPDPAIERW